MLGGSIIAKGDRGFRLLFPELAVSFPNEQICSLQGNKQSKNTDSSGFYSFVLNTNKQKERSEVVISAPTISNASYSITPGVWMVLVAMGPTGLVPAVVW